jgi:alkanesulfonate monooxygenase SsuD/methylene tetrahydromethanopterin reductase-like flavin-dependent oxidoreductase (luciferase family)
MPPDYKHRVVGRVIGRASMKIGYFLSSEEWGPRDLVRIHPAIVAQAAATASILLEGRFCLGVGSGEALDEHILGVRWPEADERLEMLEEAVEVIRELWQGGTHNHRGCHYRVERAQIYDLPVEPPPILVSGFGPKAIDVAARIGDGFVTVGPDAEALQEYVQAGFDEVYVQQIGPEQDAFSEASAEHVLPRVG